MAASGIRAGGAYIEIAEKGVEQVKRKLDSLGKTFNSMGNSIASAGTKVMAWTGAALTALGTTSKLFADFGAGLSDISARTGIGVTNLSLLKYAAEQSGTSIETLETVIKKTNKAMAEALNNPKGDMAELFQKMGLSAEQLAGMKPEDRIYALSDAMANLNEDMQEYAAVKLFKSTEAMPFLSQGSKKIKGDMQTGAEKGLGLSQEDADSAAALDDAFVSMKASVLAVVYSVGSALAPALTDLIAQATPILKQIADWIKANKGLVVSLAKALLIGLSMGASLFVLGKAIVLVGAGFKGMSMALGFGMALIKGAVTTFAFLKAAILAIPAILSTIGTVLGVLLSPIGLVIGAIAALAAGIVYFSLQIGEGANKIQSFGGLMTELKAIFGEAWQGIVDALRSGDIATAMEIVWTTLKIVWTKGVNYLLEKWIAFKDGFQRILYEAWYGIANALVSVWQGIKGGISSVTEFFRMAWEKAINWVAGIWSKLVNTTAIGWIKIKKMFGQITPEEEAAQLEALASTQKADEQARKKQHQDNLKTIADEGRADQERIEKQKTDWLNTLTDMYNEDLSRQQQGTNAELAALEAEEAVAKAKLDSLVKKAKENIKAFEGGDKNKDYVPGGGEEGNGLVDTLSKKKVTSAGTFSVYGAAALGTRNSELSVLKQISERAERQTKILMKIEARKALGMV